jgi:transcription termination factor Rho
LSLLGWYESDIIIFSAEYDILHLFFSSKEISYGSVSNDVYVSNSEVYKHYFRLAAKVLPFVRRVVKISLTVPSPE